MQVVLVSAVAGAEHASEDVGPLSEPIGQECEEARVRRGDAALGVPVFGDADLKGARGQRALR